MNFIPLLEVPLERPRKEPRDQKPEQVDGEI